jgi:peptide/nickel transport system substrate-binding protein
MTNKPNPRNLLAFILLTVLLSACQFPMGANVATPTPTVPTIDQPAAPTLTATPVPSRTLTVCLGEEPNTLYPLDGPNAAARSVLEAIYDGPFDAVGFNYQATILQRVPSVASGDALIESVPVQAGDLVVGADGNLVPLSTGLTVRPADCRSSDCAITYDGVSPLEMDQIIVTFTMLENLVWSDGEPLTAEDSLFAYNLAKDEDTPGSKFLFDRTQVYEASDETHIQWWGVPGFIDPTYYTNFWSPLPQHAWGEFDVTELPLIEAVARTPVGWGPYVMEEWIPGERLTLKKNIRYFRADENLPAFDSLVFRIVPDPNAAVSDLVAGACDILDPTINLDGQLSLLLQMQADRQAQALTTTTSTIEWLGLGITPATYDDGYSTSPPLDRPDFFYDKRTRQAIALCLDRQQVVDTVLFGLSVVPNTYITPEHPLYNSMIAPYPYDPAQGNRILEQVGWRDMDNDPSTPRLAQGVSNVPQLTPLVLNYYTSSATQRRQVSEILAQSLSQCGIGVNVTYLSYIDLYAEGSDNGPLFGRNFDLAEYAMGTTSLEPPCSWYTTAQIPTAANNWVGANVTGYKNPEFDAACALAQQQAPDDEAYLEAYHLTQSIFNSDLPAIPLYARLKVAAARPDMCNFELDPTANTLWNIESLDYQTTCAP